MEPKLEILDDGRIRHDWRLTPSEAIALQKRLADRVDCRPMRGEIRTVAGVDCCLVDAGRGILAAAVLLDAASMQPLAQAHATRACPMPYVPGLLSFREAPAEIEALAALSEQPDLLLVDGAGVAHGRGLGIASHLSLWTGIASIGVAKSRLVGEHREPGLRRGNRAALRYRGRTVGAVLRTRDGVRPLFISVGHGLSLDQALRQVLRCGRGYRLPEPTRLADRLAGELKRAAAH